MSSGSIRLSLESGFVDTKLLNDPQYLIWRAFFEEKLLRNQSWKEVPTSVFSDLNSNGATSFLSAEGFSLCEKLEFAKSCVVFVGATDLMDGSLSRCRFWGEESCLLIPVNAAELPLSGGVRVEDLSYIHDAGSFLCPDFVSAQEPQFSEEERLLFVIKDGARLSNFPFIGNLVEFGIAAVKSYSELLELESARKPWLSKGGVVCWGLDAIACHWVLSYCDRAKVPSTWVRLSKREGAEDEVIAIKGERLEAAKGFQPRILRNLVNTMGPGNQRDGPILCGNFETVLSQVAGLKNQAVPRSSVDYEELYELSIKLTGDPFRLGGALEKRKVSNELHALAPEIPSGVYMDRGLRCMLRHSPDLFPVLAGKYEKNRLSRGFLRSLAFSVLECDRSTEGNDSSLWTSAVSWLLENGNWCDSTGTNGEDEVVYACLLLRADKGAMALDVLETAYLEKLLPERGQFGIEYFDSVPGAIRQPLLNLDGVACTRIWPSLLHNGLASRAGYLNLLGAVETTGFNQDKNDGLRLAYDLLLEATKREDLKGISPLVRVRLLLYLGRVAEARACFEKVIARDDSLLPFPDLVWSLWLGYLGQREESERWMRTGMDGSVFTKCPILGGTLFATFCDWRNSQDCFENYLTDPGLLTLSPQLFQWGSVLSQAAGYEESAERLMKKAMEFDPRSIGFLKAFHFEDLKGEGLKLYPRVRHALSFLAGGGKLR